MKQRIAYLGFFLALFAAAAIAADDRAEQPFRPDVGPNQAVAIFAGGCFWCMEEAFDPIDGVTATIDGYTGGHLNDPSYEDVTAETSGHAEAVKVVYEPSKVSYAHLLQVFWHNVDPTDDNGQFCDRGDSYRSEIFYVNPAQKKAAEASKEKLAHTAGAPSPIVTRITRATTFYKAEAYHQNYYQKNPVRYHFYRSACRRDARLDHLWANQAREPKH